MHECVVASPSSKSSVWASGRERTSTRSRQSETWVGMGLIRCALGTSSPPTPRLHPQSPVHFPPVTPAENSVPEMTIIRGNGRWLVGECQPIKDAFNFSSHGQRWGQERKAATITWKSWRLTAPVNYADNLAKAEGPRRIWRC